MAWGSDGSSNWQHHYGRELEMLYVMKDNSEQKIYSTIEHWRKKINENVDKKL